MPGTVIVDLWISLVENQFCLYLFGKYVTRRVVGVTESELFTSIMHAKNK